MQDNFNTRIDVINAIHDQIDAHITGDRAIFYSAYPQNNNKLPVNNLNEIAVSGKARLVYSSYGSDEPPYVSDVVENPTWLQIAIWVDSAIKHSQDFHHHFLESIDVGREVDGVKTLTPWMGS